MEKIRIPYPVVVEGKYDKMKLASVIDANIITTGGFGIFNRREKLSLLRTLAEKGGIVVLTDSDGAGSVIRNFIKSALPAEKIYNLYIPRIEGKEHRKSAPSADGSLGVEGMTDGLIRDLFADFAKRMSFDGEKNGEYGRITKADMMELGLTGANSQAVRDALSAKLGLPPKMTPNALLGALNILVTVEELYDLMSPTA